MKNLFRAFIALAMLSVCSNSYALPNWGDNDMFVTLKAAFNKTDGSGLAIGGINATGEVLADTIVATTSLGVTGLTASRVVATDGSKLFTSTFASAALSGSLSDETGTGVAVFATSPAFTTDIHSATAGGATAGTAALPFGSVYVGGAATNNVQITGTMTAARTLTLPDDTGTNALQSTAALTPSSTVTWTPASGSVFTLVPAQDETINMSTTRAVSGAQTSLVVTTSGTSSYVLTFGTSFKSHGTLVTGTTSGVVYTVTFVYDGTNWNELMRRRAGNAVIAITPGATPAVDYAEGVIVFTDTPAQAQALAAAKVGRSGQEFRIIFTTSGTTSYTITFGTNFISNGTLETGTVTAIQYTVVFISDGTNWNELSRQRSAVGVTVLTPASTIALGYAESTHLYTDVPAQATTINTAVVGRAGEWFVIELTTSGTTSYTITFGTNMKSLGTLETGTITAINYQIKFVSDGTNWNEVSRTRDAVQSFALVDAATIALGVAEGLEVYTYTPAQTNTINCTVMPRAGKRFSIVYTTSGGSSFTTTFGTNFKTTGTLASGTVTAKVFVIHFLSDGTNMNEVSRTAAM